MAKLESENVNSAQSQSVDRSGQPRRLPNDVPNLDPHSACFSAKLYGVWVAMGFRKPRVEVQGRLDLPELLPDVRP